MRSSSTTFLKITYHFSQTMREGMRKERRMGGVEGRRGVGETSLMDRRDSDEIALIFVCLTGQIVKILSIRTTCILIKIFLVLLL